MIKQTKISAAKQLQASIILAHSVSVGNKIRATEAFTTQERHAKALDMARNVIAANELILNILGDTTTKDFTSEDKGIKL